MKPPNARKPMAMNDPKMRKISGGESQSPNPADQRKISTVSPIPAKMKPKRAPMNRAAGGGWGKGSCWFIACMVSVWIWPPQGGDRYKAAAFV